MTTSPPSSAECHEIWEPKPPGTLWATTGLLRDCFTFYILDNQLSNFSKQCERTKTSNNHSRN